MSFATSNKKIHQGFKYPLLCPLSDFSTFLTLTAFFITSMNFVKCWRFVLNFTLQIYVFFYIVKYIFKKN